jgi:predicted chitinase
LFYLQENLSKDDKTYERFALVLNTIFDKYNINTCIRKIHFLAQMYWETTYFTDLKENGEDLDYDPYRGRGFMQLTNEDTYKAYEKYSGKKVSDTPNLISDSLDLSADTAGWFWTIFKKAEYTEKKNKEKYKDILGMNLAEVSDFEDKYLGTISKLVNGGTNGKQERIDAYNALKKLFDYEESCVSRKEV